MSDKNNRFEKVYTQDAVVSRTEIWVDTVTGVHYVFHRDGNAAGFAPLLNQDGTPVVQTPSSGSY